MVNIGIIGCGYWGQNLVRNFHSAPGATVGVCYDTKDKSLDFVRKNYPTIRVTTSLEDVLSNPSIDAVAISTPVNAHYPLAKASLEAGKHALVEKPFTSSVAHARELIALAEEKGLTLAVDHTFEYMLAIREMREIIERGDLGNLRYMHADWLSLGKLQPDVNVSWDLATHCISIMNFLVGDKPISVSATGTQYVRPTREEIAQISIKYQENRRGFIRTSFLEPRKVRQMTVVGNKKMMYFNMLDPVMPIQVFDTGVDFTGEGDEARVSYRTGDIHVPYLSPGEPLAICCREFVDAINNRTTPKTSGESGLRVVQILEAADQSMKENGREVLLL